MCSSCCEGNICNMLVPRNESSAIFSSTSPLSSSGRGLHPVVLGYVAVGVILPAAARPWEERLCIWKRSALMKHNQEHLSGSQNSS